MSPTYASDGNGKVVAFHGNQVIASGTDFAKVAETADEYFNSLKHEKSQKTQAAAREAATHITTPNGEKGVILGRTSSVFSDTITVRFENGQIRHYDTFVGDGLTYSKEASDTPNSPIEYFQRKLDETFVPGKAGLTARLNTLDEVKRGAAHLASQGVSYSDGQQLHAIVLAADAERNEVGEALDHLNAADAEIAPPKQAYQAVEQASLGRSDDWLEVVAQEMVAESEAQDFDKLLQEGPVEFVSSLDDGAIANASVVAGLSRDFVVSRTAGFQGKEVEAYRDRFVAAAEMARRRESSYRSEVTKEAHVKEASVPDETPDDALFL